MYRNGVMDLIDFHDTCNKTVPIYILAGKSALLLNTVLHNYIYRKWFRPYRSEIEYDRFFCKFIIAGSLPKEIRLSHSTTATMISINKDVCAETDKARFKYDQLLVNGGLCLPWSTESLKENQFYILQPLFRAILILVSSWDYQLEDSSTVGTIPVYLVLTGITDGLSAPITFESISGKIDTDVGDMPGTVKTTLETAVNFVMGLEAREAAAFGLQPDPVASWKPRGDVERLVEGPSSRFVDTDRFPHCGGGLRTRL
ncbi:hypothetical protein F5Y16DRAFT_414462 [Xylariaceae sp. FL0255]|nr:hypothetical protein F5Y16DRAFT_414462 [Xylariaceae sp. FL0255]